MATQAQAFRTFATPTWLQTEEVELSTKLIFAALAGHLLLGALIEISPVFDYIHFYLTMIAGFAWVYWGKNRPERAAYVAAYFTACEVLWRMDYVSLFWEIGKYASAGVMLIALTKMPNRKSHPLSATYFLLLLPAAVMAYWVLGPDVGRQRVSFALSGPFLLMVGVWYFSNLRMTVEQLRRIFLSLVMGGMATGGATLYSMLTAKNLRFSNNSSMEASGGFGPNQVSAVLGVGALFLLLYLLLGSTRPVLKAVLFACTVFMAVESALTFSRGGLVDGAISFVLAATILFQEGKYRNRIVPALVVGAIAAMVVLPQLASMTGGALGKRFESTSTTHRSEMIVAELEAWGDHPIFGMGVSLASQARLAASHSSKVAHTEFSRLLAEHGAFGLGSVIMLIVMPMMRWRTVQGALPKALLVLCCCWTFAYMASNAMRLAAPSFIYGMAFVTLGPARRMFRIKLHDAGPIETYRT